MALKYKNLHESCIGCGIAHSAGCLVTEYFKDDELCRKLCPCAECLVKATCRQYCDKRMKLYNTIHLQVGKLRDQNKK